MIAVLAFVVFSLFKLHTVWDRSYPADSVPNGMEILGEAGCAKVTVQCLSTQPDWNPTVKSEGIYRVDPPGQQQDSVERQYDVETMYFSDLRQEFRVVRLERGDGYCPPGKADDFGLGEGKLTCAKYGAQEYDEFLVLDQNEDVLHHYRLEDGFSLVYANISNMAAGISRFSFDPEDEVASLDFSVHQWNMSLPSIELDDEARTYNYALNLATGELILQSGF